MPAWSLRWRLANRCGILAVHRNCGGDTSKGKMHAVTAYLYCLPMQPCCLLQPNVELASCTGKPQMPDSGENAPPFEYEQLQQ